jgi:hypothetical protein
VMPSLATAFSGRSGARGAPGLQGAAGGQLGHVRSNLAAQWDSTFTSRSGQGLDFQWTAHAWHRWPPHKRWFLMWVRYTGQSRANRQGVYRLDMV